MSRSPVFLLVKETGQHRILRKCLEGERSDELRGIVGHHRKHLMALFNKQTCQLGRFVGGDRSGHAEDNGSASAAYPHDFAGRTSFRLAIRILLHAFWIKRRLKYRSAFIMCRNFSRSSSIVRLMMVERSCARRS